MCDRKHALGSNRTLSKSSVLDPVRYCAQTSATQIQATKVRQLEDDVAQGRGDAGDLARARGLLNKMTRRLNVLTSDFQTAAVQASRSVVAKTAPP